MKYDSIGKVMNIEQIKIAKREMEDAIKVATKDAMDVFHSKSGISPRSIYIRLVDVTTIGESEHRLTISDVHAEIQL